MCWAVVGLSGLLDSFRQAGTNTVISCSRKQKYFRMRYNHQKKLKREASPSDFVAGLGTVKSGNFVTFSHKMIFFSKKP
jgi:hypothetical protein